MNKYFLKIRITKKSIIIISNSIFFLYLVTFFINMGLLQSIFINLIVFIVPGIAITYSLNRPNYTILTFFFASLLFSTLCMLLFIIAHLLLRFYIHPANYILFTFFIVNGFLIRSKHNAFTYYLNKKLFAVITFLIITIYIFHYFGGTYGISYLFDCDIERSGTSYGLLYYGKPVMLTDRNTSYFYAHPLLMNLYSAFTIFLSGHIDEMKYYYDKALERIDILSHCYKENEQVVLLNTSKEEVIATIKAVKDNQVIFDDNFPSQIMLVNCIGARKILNTPQQRISIGDLKKYKIEDAVNDMERYYMNKPFFLPGRMPLFFLSVFTCFVLSAIVFRLTNSNLWTTVANIIYFTIPEIYIFNSGGIYTTIINLAMLFLLYYYLFYPNNHFFLFIAGAFCALSSQKTIILPFSIVVWEFIRRENYLQKIKHSLLNKSVLGFIFGMLIFWIYGFSTNAETFWVDHVRHHFLDRIFHIKSFGYLYPPRLNLWVGFIKNIGIFLFLFLLYGIIINFIKIVFPKRAKLGVVFIWFIVGALVYSWVDWRVHYHLLLIVPPLVIGGILYFSSVTHWIKYCILSILIYFSVYNLFVIYKLIASRNFFDVYRFMGI